MARNSDLAGILESLGVPVIVGGWCEDEVAQFPCVEYHKESPNVLHADTENFYTSDRWLVSVYAMKKDAAGFWGLCEKLEQALASHKVVFRRSGDLFHEELISAQYNFSLLRD